MSKKTVTVGEFLFQYLYEKGAKTAFGIPGDFALPTFRHLEASPIELITLTHEPSVGFAADGYARINGLGVAVVTYCVGGLNMVNPIACAYAEKSPVIVISGGPSPNDRRKDAMIHHKVKTFDTQRKIYEEVTCANTVLLDPDRAAREIVRVVETVMRESRPGYIEVPFDVVDMPIRLDSFEESIQEESDQESLSALMEEVAKTINNAKQPVILADIELQRHKLAGLAVEIAEKFNIPIASTLLSKSIINETHPLYIGTYSGNLSDPACKEYVENSDCLIMLGAFVSDVLQGFMANYDRLSRHNSIMVTTETARVGLRHYHSVKFPDFVNALKDSAIKPRNDFRNPCPIVPLKPLATAEMQDALDSESFFRILSLDMGDNAAFVCDTGDAIFGAIDIRTTEKQNFFADAYYLSMGFSVPAAVGVMAANRTANPDAKTFVLVGDGAFQMTGMEVSTFAKYNMAPVVIVLNNDGYGTQRFIIDGAFNNILQWRYTKVIDVLGKGKSVQVRTKGELDNALKEAVKSSELYLIEVMLPRDSSSRALKSVGKGLKEQRDRKQ